MAMPNGEISSDELFGAQAHVWNHTFKFIDTMSLKCAVVLGIPDIIHNHGKSMTLSQLVDALSINQLKSRHLFYLMRVLVHSKFFIKVGILEDEAYWLTPASHLLPKHDPFCTTPFCRVVGNRLMQEPWAYLSVWLAGDHHLTPFEAAHGMTFWDYTERMTRLGHLFNEAMASDSRLVNHEALANCKEAFEGIKSLVDVGGSTGAMAKAIAYTFLAMACLVLYLPHVAGLQGKDNLTYVEGNMFEAIPHAGLVLLKNQSILYDWNDEDSIKILKKCKEAIGGSKERRGKVMIIYMVLNSHGGGDKAMEDQLFYDMAMMTCLNAKRTRRERIRSYLHCCWIQWLQDYS